MTPGRELIQKIHKKYKFLAFPHLKSHEFLKPLIYLQLETRESAKVNPERHEIPANALIDPLIITNKESTFLNFALFALCIHFQDQFVTLVLSRPYLMFNQMHSMTTFTTSHQPTPLTLLGTPIDTFLYFAD